MSRQDSNETEDIMTTSIPFEDLKTDKKLKIAKKKKKISKLKEDIEEGPKLSREELWL